MIDLDTNVEKIISEFFNDSEKLTTTTIRNFFMLKAKNINKLNFGIHVPLISAKKMHKMTKEYMEAHEDFLNAAPDQKFALGRKKQ